MNAVIEHGPQPTVALLGPADDARAQLRQALQSLGAELVFEGELNEAPRLQSDGLVPSVLLVNLEPGVEDELDALQDLLDHPEVSVVFNEGEVSSRLSGWDLARWARHLAAKVLGVRDTLPPAPAGAERLPVLDLVPEPGRPTTPAQQDEHLRFDDYADEVLGLQDGVPASPRLDAIEPELPAGLASTEAGATSASGFDFDFSPVAPDPLHSPPDGSRLEQRDAGAETSLEAEVDLDQVDLESVFEQGLDQMSPDDLLLKLQAAMGLEPRVPPTQSPELRAEQARAAGEAAAEAAQQALEGFDFESSLAKPSAPGPEPVQGFSFDPVEAEFEPATAGAADPIDTGSVEVLEADQEASLLDELAQWSPASVASPGSEAEEAPPARWSASAEEDLPLSKEGTGFDGSAGSDAFEASAIEASTVEAFDFSSFDLEGEPAPAVDDGHDPALGGSVQLAAGADDEEIARLAAALDEAADALPPAVEVDPLDFSHLRKSAEAESSPPARAEAAPAAEARAVAKPSFAELSLAPLESEPVPVAPPPATPAPSFDFSKLELSLEPLEGEESEPPPVASPAPPSTPRAEVADAVAEAMPGDFDAVDALPPAASGLADPEPLDSEWTPPVHAEDGFEPAPSPVAPAAALGPERAAVPVGVSRVVVLCASIGGPDAVRSFLDSLPAGFPALFLVVQHLESGYFERLAQQLQKASKLPVRVPIAGTSAQDGEVLVVTSESRLLVNADGAIELTALASQSRYRPCIDDVLRDVADTFGNRAVAVIFSGMAADAVEGAVYLTQRGGEVWAQDPESCVVSSMVDGARARGVVEFVGSPRELAAHCMRRLRF